MLVVQQKNIKVQNRVHLKINKSFNENKKNKKNFYATTEFERFCRTTSSSIT